MRPFICTNCGKTFDDPTKAKQHVAARTGGCTRRNAEVLRRRVEIRASDRVVGGRERFDDYVSNVNAEPAGDGGSNGRRTPSLLVMVDRMATPSLLVMVDLMAMPSLLVIMNRTSMT